LDDLRGALEEARRDPRDFGTAMLIRGDMEVVRSKIGQQKLRIEQHTLKQNPKHFSGIPNQVAWLRSAMGELDGQKVLAFGEGQSDPHQLARVFGYLSPDGTALPEEAARLKSRLDKAQENLDALEKLPKDKITTELDYNLRKAFLKADDADHMYGQYVGQSEGSGGVLPLPFQKDSEWSELLLKRALHEVSQKDLEGIVFPTGRAVSQAVGMPEGGRKFYDKELPNQLMEYLKKQFGVETAPQQIMSDVPATIRDVSNLLDPMMVGPRQYAVPDLPGPLPEGYEMDFRNILNALGTDPMESQPTSILDQLGRSGVGRIVNILNSENPVSNVGLDTFMNDYKIAAQNLYKPPQSFGTFIPVPEEARQKILTDGQRLWAAFLAAGLPSLLSQQKKDDPKRTRSKGS